jgi:protein gp37
MAARFCDEGQPYYQLAKRTASGPRWTGKIAFVKEHLADPIKWSKPRRIFVNSMSDLFYEDLTNEQIAAIFGVMAATPRHTFQCLTKRSKRMREWFKWISEKRSPLRFCGDAAEEAGVPVYKAGKDGRSPWNDSRSVWPLPNVWIGVSVENQEAADERIPDLLACPAAIRFLSCEPLIGPVTLPIVHVFGDNQPPPHIDWIIAGCESGPGMRPCDYRWLRSLRDQCRETGTKFFLKQATKAQEGGHRLYPSGQAARAPIVDVVAAGEGSKVKPGGVIERPYLDGFQHQEFPA